MVAEARDFEIGALEAIVPRQGHCADSAADAAADVMESVELGKELADRARRRPDVGGAEAVGIGLAGFDAMQDMQRGAVGDFRPRRAVESARARINDDARRTGDGGVRRRAAAATTACSGRRFFGIVSQPPTRNRPSESNSISQVSLSSATSWTRRISACGAIARVCSKVSRQNATKSAGSGGASIRRS
jgi:hypothetical protein